MPAFVPATSFFFLISILAALTQNMFSVQLWMLKRNKAEYWNYTISEIHEGKLEMRLLNGQDTTASGGTTSNGTVEGVGGRVLLLNEGQFLVINHITP